MIWTMAHCSHCETPRNVRGDGRFRAHYLPKTRTACPNSQQPAPGHEYEIPLEVSLIHGEVEKERQRQLELWGEQNHPDGTGAHLYTKIVGETEITWGDLERLAKRRVQRGVRDRTLTWLDIMLEEMAESFAEGDPAKLRVELIQVAAVAIQWIETIDRRKR